MALVNAFDSGAEGVVLERRVLSLFYGISLVMTLLLTASLVVASTRAFPLYLSALYTNLFGMAVLFLRLVASLVSASAPGDE